MNKNDFKYFHSSSKMLQFCKVPYTKVFQIRFCKEDLHIIDNNLLERAKVEQSGIDSRATAQQINILKSRKQKCEKQVNPNRKNNLRTILKFMSVIDRHYYKSLGISEN